MKFFALLLFTSLVSADVFLDESDLEAKIKSFGCTAMWGLLKQSRGSDDYVEFEKHYRSLHLDSCYEGGQKQCCARKAERLTAKEPEGLIRNMARDFQRAACELAQWEGCCEEAANDAVQRLSLNFNERTACSDPGWCSAALNDKVITAAKMQNLRANATIVSWLSDLRSTEYPVMPFARLGFLEIVRRGGRVSEKAETSAVEMSMGDLTGEDVTSALQCFSCSRLFVHLNSTRKTPQYEGYAKIFRSLISRNCFSLEENLDMEKQRFLRDGDAIHTCIIEADRAVAVLEQRFDLESACFKTDFCDVAVNSQIQRVFSGKVKPDTYSEFMRLLDLSESWRHWEILDALFDMLEV